MPPRKRPSAATKPAPMKTPKAKKPKAKLTVLPEVADLFTEERRLLSLFAEHLRQTTAEIRKLTTSKQTDSVVWGKADPLTKIDPVRYRYRLRLCDSGRFQDSGNFEQHPVFCNAPGSVIRRHALSAHIYIRIAKRLNISLRKTFG